MLREIKILKDDVIIFEKVFGRTLTPDEFNYIWNYIREDIGKPIFNEKDTLYRYFYTHQLAIKFDSSKRLIFVFVTDIRDDRDNVAKKLNQFVNIFLDSVCANEISTNNSENAYEIFLKSVDQAFKRLWPKISLIGYSGVGKTTILKLIQGSELPKTHEPTVSGDIASCIDEETGTFLRVWDYAGQRLYQNQWDLFLDGSDMVLIITDSTPENCEKSVKIVDLLKKKCPDAELAIIANKQDIIGALSVEEIQETFKGIEIFPLVATDINNRGEILYLITKTVEIYPAALKIPGVELDEEGIIGACELKEDIETQTQESNNTTMEQELMIAPNLMHKPQNMSSVEDWFFESLDVLEWVFKKAASRPKPNKWHITHDWLRLQEDCPIKRGELEIVWNHLKNSPYLEKKGDSFIITNKGRNFFEIVLD